ncbi:HAMP domain-containing protein [candidate division KSB1 bacterium]|nr:HAMP domain-containing protein [candidate division KSB1 bacterium]
MKRLRSKLIVFFALFVIAPTVPVAFLVQNFLQRSLSIGVNQQVSLALEDAFKLYQDTYTGHRADLDHALESFSRESAFPEQILNKYNLEMIEIFSNKKLRSRITRTDSFSFYTPQNVLKKVTTNHSNRIELEWKNGRLLQAGARSRTAENDTVFVLVSKLLDSEFVQSANRVRDVLQMFRTLDIQKKDVRNAFLLAFLIVYLPFLGAAVLLARYFSKKLTLPIEQLAAATQKVQEGEWDVEIKTDSRDEVGSLVTSFNLMVANLKTNQEKLISLEKMAAWREIARILAHEIKNPLTPIQLMVQQLRDEYPGGDGKYAALLTECTDIISDEVNNLRNLVQEFSNFARMPRVNKETADMNVLLDDVCRLYGTRKLQVELEQKLPDFAFDAEKMRRVFINLLDNAIAADESGSPIRVLSKLQNNTAVIRISDSGPGIAPELLHKIFEPYFSTKHRGMGLGLAVVQKVVQEHGGTITVENLPTGGAAFSIKLPLVEEIHV